MPQRQPRGMPVFLMRDNRIQIQATPAPAAPALSHPMTTTLLADLPDGVHAIVAQVCESGQGLDPDHLRRQIGRASCRERVYSSV